ncbi:MAG TPA: helix-turn-helix domain-containing protein [Acidimicrobiales bacterium]|nr:helix-turn-helix domain-containing protein [Acidimicrobiales bacterium]
MRESLPLVGRDGPAVLVTGAVAYRLSRLLMAEMRRARDRGERLDPDLVATVLAIDEAGREYATRRVLGALAASADGSTGIPSSDDRETNDVLTTTEVAERLGCSTRNVRALAERGALPGRRVGRSWTFDLVDVQEYIDARRTDESD